MAVFEKKDGAVVFNWSETLPGTWELGGDDIHAIVELIKHSAGKYIVSAKLVMPKLHGQRLSGYSSKTDHDTEGKALDMVDHERGRIEKAILDVMGSDHVLKVLGAEEAVDFVRGISTCARCGRKFVGPRYHRYCDDCGEARK